MPVLLLESSLMVPHWLSYRYLFGTVKNVLKCIKKAPYGAECLISCIHEQEVHIVSHPYRYSMVLIDVVNEIE